MSSIVSPSLDKHTCIVVSFKHSHTLVDKKLHRGISRATEDNVDLVSRARTEIAMDFHTNCYKQPDIVQNIDSPDYTFTLPDITIYSDDFRRFLEKDLIETSTLASLESTQRLNWWADTGHCRKLWPLSTSGDGNCLLHAASLSLWGFHDRKLTLRTALHGVLSQGEYRDALWRRWRFQQTRLNKQAGFVYSEIEWSREWEDIVSLASPEPRQSSSAKGVSRRRSVVLDRQNDSFEDHNNATYESLEEIHIFALAHVLRRTIIVVADTVLRDMNGEAMAPIPFGGVYLPFEIAASDCHRAPLLLTYDMAHFSALVSMESIPGDALPICIPLVDIDNILLTIQFCIDPGRDFNWTLYDGAEGNWALSDREHIALLKEYLEVVHVSPIGTPDEELFDDLTDEEFEKRIADIEIVLHNDDTTIPSNEALANGKSKAAKQLQSVAKQFGSIGKSMSKKIKKNIGSIAKIGNSNHQSSTSSKSSNKLPLMSSTASTQSFNSKRILCAQLKAQRYEYQEEMIRNYLECAQNRFIDNEKTKALRQTTSDSTTTTTTTTSNGTIASLDKVDAIDESATTCCINAGCQNFGTAATSYMCSDCFEKQRQQEMNSHFDQPPRYGTGNSRFYTQADVNSHQQISRLPSVRRLNELDQTLYLSNSTFYNDKRQQNPDVQPGYEPIVKPANNYQLSDEEHRILDMHRSPEASSYNAANPHGRASVYSPGKTIIHNIVRHTVNLPPSNSAGVADLTPIVPRNAYTESTASAVDCVDGLGIAPPSTPFVPCQTARSCRTLGCRFFGSASTNFYCSKCCKQLDEIATLVNSSQQPRTQSKVLTDV